MDIRVPVFSESVSEGEILAWHKQPGESVKRDELLVEIATDKVTLEITALADGAMGEQLKKVGDLVESEDLLGTLHEGQAGQAKQAETSSAEVNAEVSTEGNTEASAQRREELSPAVRKLVTEKGLDPQQIPATGPKGHLSKADVLNATSSAKASSAKAPETTAPTSTPVTTSSPVSATLPEGLRPTERVPMTRIRSRIAERLKDVQNTAALLTTFNEVNMQPIMSLRKKYQEQFVAKHGIKLGFMSLFVRAATEALKTFPVVNARVEGKDIVYHGFYDIGIAVASERGLVVPILRDTDQLSLADVEKQIAGYAQKAKTGKLTIEDMTGGTFSITNGGTFGSMMSTPIINAPQSAILGMHNIIERPIAQNGQVVIAPMMYLALSYDHRIIDGKEAVQFLVMIKNLLEDPTRLLLEL